MTVVVHSDMYGANIHIYRESNMPSFDDGFSDGFDSLVAINAAISGGEITIGGCIASPIVANNYSFEHNAYETVFIKANAKHGELYKITIKEIVLTDYTSNTLDYFYRDTFNDIWRADEVVDRDEAVSLVTAYLDRTSRAVEMLCN